MLDHAPRRCLGCVACGGARREVARPSTLIVLLLLLLSLALL
jgi:hypothetical protein